MPAPFNFLITSAGKRCQLIDCFRRDAAELGLDIKIFAVDLNPSMSPACQIADKSVEVPRCTEPSYTDSILQFCSDNEIKLVVPTIDTELQVFSRNLECFQEIGCLLALSKPEAVKLSQNKFATSETAAKLGISIPASSMMLDFAPNDLKWTYPLIFKPNSGSNSQGLAWAESPDSLPALDTPQNYLVQDCILGTEYTTNCYFDQGGKLLAAVPHERVEIRGGEVSKAITRKVPQLDDIAKKIEAANMGWKGPICFQTIEKDGTHFLIEINARFGGGYPVAHQAGAPFSKWLIQESLGLQPDPLDDWKSDIVMLRYDSAVYSNA